MLLLVENENIRHDYNQRIVDNARAQNNCCLTRTSCQLLFYLHDNVFCFNDRRANVGEQLLLAYT